MCSTEVRQPPVNDRQRERIVQTRSAITDRQRESYRSEHGAEQAGVHLVHLGLARLLGLHLLGGLRAGRRALPGLGGAIFAARGKEEHTAWSRAAVLTTTCLTSSPRTTNVKQHVL